MLAIGETFDTSSGSRSSDLTSPFVLRRACPERATGFSQAVPGRHTNGDNSSGHHSFERMSRLGEEVAPFLAALQMTGLITIGPVANAMRRDGAEDLFVGVLTELGVFLTAESNYWLKRFKSLNRSFEAQFAE